MVDAQSILFTGESADETVEYDMEFFTSGAWHKAIWTEYEVPNACREAINNRGHLPLYLLDDQ